MRWVRSGFTCTAGSSELGIQNYMVQPRDWDERGKGVKNERLDAAELCQRLDRYERGNKKAFSIVRIPTVDEERERAMSRQRQQLMRERQRVARMSRGLFALHDIHDIGKWWKGKAWAAIKVLVPEWVIGLLEVFIKILNPLDEQELKLMHQLQEAAKEGEISRGVGPLTFEILRREVGDWALACSGQPQDQELFPRQGACRPPIQPRVSRHNVSSHSLRGLTRTEATPDQCQLDCPRLAEFNDAKRDFQ